MPDTDAMLAYHEAVEEQLRGNFRIAEVDALKTCRKRSKTINIRQRRGQSPRVTAAEIAVIEKIAALPHDWRP